MECSRNSSGPREMDPVSIFGIDPNEDRRRIRALRAMPPGGASNDDVRRRVFSAALGQFDELLDAASSVGPASCPLPLYYALNQASRAIAASLQQPDRPWQAHRHGLSISGPDGSRLQGTTISPQQRKPGTFDILAEGIRAPGLTAETALANIWAAVPGLDKPGLGAGCPRALPLEFDSSSPSPVSAWLRRLPGLPANEAGRDQLAAHIAETYPQASQGLTVQSIEPDGPANAVKAEIAWRSPDGTWRTVYTAATPYLWHTSLWLIPRLSSGDVLPPLLLWWCLLQALSSLARYHPAEWTAALDPDSSQFAVSIEKALATGLAVIPRLVLVTLSPGASRSPRDVSA
jgi:hypothetical protein